MDLCTASLAVGVSVTGEGVRFVEGEGVHVDLLPSCETKTTLRGDGLSATYIVRHTHTQRHRHTHTHGAVGQCLFIWFE